MLSVKDVLTANLLLTADKKNMHSQSWKIILNPAEQYIFLFKPAGLIKFCFPIFHELATGALWLTQTTTFCWNSARELLLRDRFTVITRANCVGFFLVDKWPPGHYCILAKGPCPTGFLRSSGHMRALKIYASSADYIKPATFGDSRIQCHGQPCGRYGQWIGELHITACCKWWGNEITYLSTIINPINNQNGFISDNRLVTH